jgi:RND family efflux transporter MFP subunit
MKQQPLSQVSAHRTFYQHAKVLTLTLAVVTSLTGCSGAGNESTPDAVKPALTVNVTSAVTQSLPSMLAANGTVAAWQEAIVGTEVNGLRVSELFVNVGDHVKKGQSLATLARDSVMNDVRLAQAALSEARATAAETKADGDRARMLQGTGTLSEQQIQQLLTREQTALARVESAQAQLDAQQLRLSQTTVRAPDDGIISARSATIGSVPAQGAEMFRLIRKGRLEWRGELTDKELEQVQPGQLVRIVSPAGNVWKGSVRQTAPTVDQATRRGLAYVDIVVTEGKETQPIRPGAYVRGELDMGMQQGLVVPQSAVIARDGFHLLFVVGDDLRVSQRKVKIGRLVGDRQEILDGVRAGERFVTTGAAFLSDGDTVQLADARKP